MSKTQKLILWIVLAAAVLVMVFCTLNYLNLKGRLRETSLQLSDSRVTWEGIAAEKEALQEDLKTIKNELKEAELSLEEAQTRAEEIREEIKTLQDEIKTYDPVGP